MRLGLHTLTVPNNPLYWINTCPGLFTSRGCYRCEAPTNEAVVVHRELVVTKQMW